jgi:hypothetical protein
MQAKISAKLSYNNTFTVIICGFYGSKFLIRHSAYLFLKWIFNKLDLSVNKVLGNKNKYLNSQNPYFRTTLLLIYLEIRKNRCHASRESNKPYI